MRERGGVAGFLVKWLVVPAALVAVGYFFIGPNVGRNLVGTGTSEEKPPRATTTPVEPFRPTPEETSSAKPREPEVTITARPVEGERRTRTRRTSNEEDRPRRTRPRPAPEAQPESDPASAGGIEEAPPESDPASADGTVPPPTGG